MVGHASDRRALEDGGLVVSASPIADGGVEALLALADGSVWSVSRPDAAAAATGPVRIVGGRVLVADAEVASLSDPEAARVADHLSQSSAPGDRVGPHGCVSAAGATTPVHRAVALAVARGEIGRPW